MLVARKVCRSHQEHYGSWVVWLSPNLAYEWITLRHYLLCKPKGLVCVCVSQSHTTVKVI